MNTQRFGKKPSRSLTTLRQTIHWESVVRLMLFSFVICLVGANSAAALPRNLNVGRPGSTGVITLPPLGPTVAPVVNAAADFSAAPSTPTSVGLRWFNQGAPQTLLKRSVNGGPWSVIQTYGELPVNAYSSFLDSSATLNAENCYIVTVTDGANSWSALSTPIRCAFTRDGRDLPVHRLQLRLRVPNVSGAATDDDVEVRLQSPSWLVPTVTNWRPAGNSTWIDSTADDFERGSNRKYDLMLTHISQASDITMITISKTGNDDLCIAELELLIDGQSAFQRTFGDQIATCAWVTVANLLTVDFDELRTNLTWNMLSLPTFVGINGAGLRSVIEATFAHELYGSGGLRNGGTTTSQRLSESRLHVSVPIVVYDVFLLGDVDSSVHFDLVMTPAVVNGIPKVKISVENPDADSQDLLGYFLPILGWKILYEVSETIEDKLADIAPFSLDQPPLSGIHVCFTQDAGIGACFDSSSRQQKRVPVLSR
ncbi:MAG: hypothetical protein AB7P69_03995 [Candidatus Binatia bacterium]